VNLLRLLRVHWDRVAAWVLVAAGAAAIVIGWFGVRSRALTAGQIPYVMSGGIGGLFLLGLGAMLWLSADLRDEWRKLDRIEAALLGEAEHADGDAGSKPTDEPEMPTISRRS